MKKSIISVFFVSGALCVAACTSAIFSAGVTRDGHPLLWKHRDTGTQHNFVARVAAREPGDADYVALFNAGDSLLREAWIGVNSRGLAVMNTASYNLAPDTAVYRDREGEVMTLALRRCSTTDDFARMLDSLPKPLGVQANFGVLDARGDGAYFETDDYGYTRYGLADASGGYMTRTNYSCSGDTACGFGYIREQNALTLLRPAVEADTVSPELLTDMLSRSFYHSLLGRDMLAGGDRWIVDMDFIPRYSSSASVVVEMIGGRPVMWTAIGYPPASYVLPVTVDSVPAALQPDVSTWRSALCDTVVARKQEVFPIKRGSGPHYIDAARLRALSDSCRRVSLDNYRSARSDFGSGVGHY